MTTRELVQAEIERLSESDLQAVYDMIKRLHDLRAKADKSGGLLARLGEIKIEGPEDFAENLDLYLSGEKRVEDDLR